MPRRSRSPGPQPLVRPDRPMVRPDRPMVRPDRPTHAESVPVTAAEFLTHTGNLPYLVDLAPELDADGAPVAGRLVTMVRARGRRHADVRLLVTDGRRYRAAAAELADRLRCDVYLPPPGAALRLLRETAPGGAESWDAVLTDAATGEPVEWLTIRPAGTPKDVPRWYRSHRGRLRLRAGLVRVALPSGIAFATKATIRDAATLAASLRPSATRLLSVAVTVADGRFEITRFDGTGSLLRGVEFATLVGASFDVIHPDLQLAFTWPADEPTCAALDAELMRLADALNRTVWVPEPAGAAFLLAGCGEFAAVDEVGSPARWRAYQSRLDTEWRPRYSSDPDGRLVPIGEVATASFSGVPLVSVPAARLDRWRERYAAVDPTGDGGFAVDFAVLSDGRLGLSREDGQILPIGPRHLRALLTDRGWAGQDLIVLARPPAEVWQSTVEHLRYLVDALAVNIWVPASGAEVDVEDGRLTATGPDGADHAWHAVRYGRDPQPEAGLGQLPAALAPPPEPEAPEPELEPEPEPATVATGQSTSDVEVTAPAGAVSTPNTAGRRSGSRRGGLPHRVAWLPGSPAVNQRATDLYLWQADDPGGAALATADMFLLAGQDPLRIAERRRGGYLLRIAAPARAAVDLLEYAPHLPEPVGTRLAAGAGTHLIPLAWLGGYTVTGGYHIDNRGGLSPGAAVMVAPLQIRFAGAGHGVPGLPDEVVRWPDRRLRADAPAYLLLPPGLDNPAEAPYLPLWRRRPRPSDGEILGQVLLGRRAAIDVSATLVALAGLPIVPPPELRGHDLILPRTAYLDGTVTKLWPAPRTGSRRRRPADPTDGVILPAALPVALARLRRHPVASTLYSPM